MTAATGKNLLMSVLLSLALTLLFAVLYAFYPLILALLAVLLNSSGTGGIGSVAGGVSGSFVKVLLPLALILFFVIFGLLQRRAG